MAREICFKDFISWHRRGGGGLVAESDVSRTIEKHFGKFYVSHIADSDILTTLHDMIKREAFLLEIVGVPGVGKTKLLKELIEDLDPNCFESKYREQAIEVNKAFRFLNVEEIESVHRGSRVRDPRQLVWVTLNIDEFVSVGEGINPLQDLYSLLDKNFKKGEALIICGNIGVLENKKAREAIKEIHKLMEFRTQREVKHIRFPRYKSLYWTKEYGIYMERYGVEGDPAFLVSGAKGFQDYSCTLIRLGVKILKECLTKAQSRPKCKKCVGLIYQEYLERVSKLLEREDFVDRLHDLIEYMWLKHADLYLVARTINIFWGYAFSELWGILEKKGEKHGEKREDSVIYQSLYLAKFPSIYHVSEYELSETGVHRFRDKTFEQNLLSSATQRALNDPDNRLRNRLRWFFSKLSKSESREKIHGGVFQEYLDQGKLTSCLTDIAKRLVFMRLDESLLFIPESDERFRELYQAPWGFPELVLASRVTGIQRRDKRTIRVPLLMFNESVLNSISIQSGVAFEEIQKPTHYLTNREKILALKLRLGNDVPQNLKRKAPHLHLSLMDYNALRTFTKGFGRPDISLYRPTLVKVHSFLDEIEGFTTHEIRPLLWKHFREDINKGDTSRILVRTLGPDTRRCALKIDDKHVVVDQDGVEIIRWEKKGFQ